MSKVFQFDTPSQSPGFLLWKVNNYWQREIKIILLEFDLTHGQFVVLANTFYMGFENDNVTQMDIANQVGIDKMLISNIIKALLKKELVTRKEHETDTRAKTIKTTKAGKALLKMAVKSVEDFDTSFFSNLKNIDSFNKDLLLLLSEK